MILKCLLLPMDKLLTQDTKNFLSTEYNPQDFDTVVKAIHRNNLDNKPTGQHSAQKERELTNNEKVQLIKGMNQGPEKIIKRNTEDTEIGTKTIIGCTAVLGVSMLSIATYKTMYVNKKKTK